SVVDRYQDRSVAMAASVESWRLAGTVRHGARRSRAGLLAAASCHPCRSRYIWAGIDIGGAMSFQLAAALGQLVGRALPLNPEKAGDCTLELTAEPTRSVRHRQPHNAQGAG